MANHSALRIEAGEDLAVGAHTLHTREYVGDQRFNRGASGEKAVDPGNNQDGDGEKALDPELALVFGWGLAGESGNSHE